MNANPNAGGREEFNLPVIFTKREYEILYFSRQLKTNQEIANLLGIGETTVKSHRKNIMNKLEIKGKAAMNRFIMTFKKD